MENSLEPPVHGQKHFYFQHYTQIKALESSNHLVALTASFVMSSTDEVMRYTLALRPKRDVPFRYADRFPSAGLLQIAFTRLILSCRLISWAVPHSLHLAAPGSSTVLAATMWVSSEFFGFLATPRIYE